MGLVALTRTGNTHIFNARTLYYKSNFYFQGRGSIVGKKQKEQNEEAAPPEDPEVVDPAISEEGTNKKIK